MQQVPEEASQQRSETPSYRQKGLLASIAGGLVIATLLAAAVWRSGVLRMWWRRMWWCVVVRSGVVRSGA